MEELEAFTTNDGHIGTRATYRRLYGSEIIPARQYGVGHFRLIRAQVLSSSHHVAGSEIINDDNADLLHREI